MAPAQHKKKGPNKEHRCGAGRIPSESQVRTSHNFRVLERGKLCVPWLVMLLGLLQQQGVNIPQWDQKSFPFRNLLEAYFTGSFPYGNPFGFCEAWRASYFLIYTIRGWQANIDQYRQLVLTPRLLPHQPHEGISPMKSSALGCPLRLPVTSFPTMNIMETDGRERCRQPVSLSSSHVVDVERQPTHGYVIYLFFFHITIYSKLIRN